jgi:cysteine-rich repeat protein
MCGARSKARGGFTRGCLLLGLAFSRVVGLACTNATGISPGADAAVTVVVQTEEHDAFDIAQDSKDTSRNLCGNGLQDPGEECDDGNAVNGDGCSNCLVEPCSVCPRFGQPCVEAYACGNGFLSSDEDCDDGNTTGGDGCSAGCRQVEAGWRCRMPGRPSTEVCGADAAVCATTVCGNGIVEPGEESDDGSDPSRTPHNDDHAQQPHRREPVSSSPSFRPRPPTSATTRPWSRSHRIGRKSPSRSRA